MPPSLSRFALLRGGRPTVLGIVLLVIIVAALLWLGRVIGYDSGYAQAKSDIQSIQEEAARNAAEEAAKSANPFQAINPLEGIEANPFEKVKKILNPFEG